MQCHCSTSSLERWPTLTDVSPRAWLLDLDGTLYRPGLVKAAMGLSLLTFGVPHLAALRRFRQEHEALRQEQADAPDLTFSPSPFAVQLERTAEALGQKVSSLERIVQSWMFDRPGPWLRLSKNKSLLAEIRNFRGQGGKTALVSDYPASRKLQAMGIAELFDLVVANGETAGLVRLKPAPDAYLLAASELELPPHDCLVIGDREDADGEAARRAGMAFRLERA